MVGTDDYQSIIAVDFGSVNTRAVLIALVDGAYRMVARSVTRTTADDPHRDVEIGLFRALEILQEQTGRDVAILDSMELIRPDKGTRGVDAFVATASVGQPLRVVVVGLMPDVSVSSAHYVLTGSYVDVVDTLSLADVRTEEQQINAILAHKPDLIFIVGGTDAGAEAPILELVQVVRTAVQIAPHPLMVLYAGNQAVQSEVVELLDGIAPLFVSGNVRPSLTEETVGPAQQGLARVYDHFKVGNEGGFEAVSRLSNNGVLPTAQSFTNVVRYLGEVLPAAADDGGVLAVDIGSSSTTVAAAIGGRTYSNIRTDMGVGHSAAGTLSRTTPGNIRRWLTWDATADEISAYAYNKALRPASLPQTAQELELEYALAREAIRLTVAQVRRQWPRSAQKLMPPLRPIIGAGGLLANTPHSSVAALLLLDAIQPVGVTELWLDSASLIPALGAAGYLAPPAFVQMLDAGDLLKIGSVVCAGGQARRLGALGFRVSIKHASGLVEKKDVPAGSIWTYPLPSGQTAEVTVRTGRGLNIAGRSRLKTTLEGGTAGLIFDARGRPLPLPLDAEVRGHLFGVWNAGIRGLTHQLLDEMDEALLDRDLLRKAEMITGDERVVEDARPQRRRGLFGWRRGAVSVDDELDEALLDEATPEAEEEPQSEFLAELSAPEEEPVETDTAAAEESPAPEKEQRRRLFGRRKAKSAEVVEEPAPDAEAPSAPPDEVDDMMAELRGSTGDEAGGRKRRGLRRR